MRVQGSSVLLTGASGGIGQAIARALHDSGATLKLSGRRLDALEQLRDALGSDAELLPANLSHGEEVQGLAERAGNVDVLVSNAALPGSGRLESFSPKEIDRAIDVNLRAPVQLARALLPGMVERGTGHLVFISSLSGKVASPRSPLYSATKFGLRGLAHGLRHDLHGTGVGVSAVYPGFVADAGMFAETGVTAPGPLRPVSPERVAGAVVRGIEEGRLELDVASLPARVGAIVGNLLPALSARVQHRFGGAELAESIAKGQASKR
ncbi:MAG: SDR family NAD(P)-dependent oxidoreductase [Thermoleophilaceae bacterium]